MEVFKKFLSENGVQQSLVEHIVGLPLQSRRQVVLAPIQLQRQHNAIRQTAGAASSSMAPVGEHAWPCLSPSADGCKYTVSQLMSGSAHEVARFSWLRPVIGGEASPPRHLALLAASAKGTA